MKKIWQWIIIIPILVGVGVGVYITVNKQIQISTDNNKLENVFGIASSRTAKISKFYSFGTSLNVEGKIDGISEDNFEGIKIVVTDGADYNKNYDAEYSFEGEILQFSTLEINNSIDLENLQNRRILCISKIKIKQ